MMFSTTCQYAIRAVLLLALNTDDSKKIGGGALAEELDIPKHFLAKIMQKLTKSKLVSSSKGRNGGFYLSEENKASNLLNIIYTIDGRSIFEDCVLGLRNCSDANQCPYHSYAKGFRKDFLDRLRTESISDSAKRIEQLNLKLKL